jgi:UDP-N-acetylglucosamine 2-epimerase (non-hydrolysing)
VDAPVLHVLGARPNFMKAAPVVHALAARGVEQLVVHTGQHYDEKLSDVFFRQLNLPEPDVNLGVGSGTHARQTATIMVGLEDLLLERPACLVIVYGDVNSTVAAALVSSKLGIPMCHIEAGLRSFDMTMPEEINRRITDQLCDLLLVTSPEAVGHLAREGVAADRIHFVGNPMIDTLLGNLDRFDSRAARSQVGAGPEYVVVTMHRPGNVDDPEKVTRLVEAFTELSATTELVIPLHPRGRGRFEAAGLVSSPTLHIVEPLGYLEFMGLVRGARAVLTDSGGIQEETTVLGVPCLTVRPNTERPITISHGTNRLIEPDEIVPAVTAVLEAERPDGPRVVPPLWDGKAGDRIAGVITDWSAGRTKN